MPRRAASVLHLLALALIGLVLPSAGVDAQERERARVEIVPQIGHARDVTSGAFSRDGTHLLTGSEDGTLKLWDLATTRLVRTFSGHKGGVTVVALSPDGSRALSGSKDKAIRLWEVATGRLIRTVYAHLDSSSEVSSVAFSPDGKRLLSSSKGEGAAKLWDADTGRLVRMFRHSTKSAFHSNVSAAVFSPDGTRVATGGVGDHMVSLWDAETGQRFKTFGKLPDKTFGYRVNLAFSPDGTRLLTGDTESLKLWDTAKGTPIRTLASHGLGVSGSMGGFASGITFVAFSPDGAFALTSDRENGLQHWRVATGQLVRTLKPKPGEPVAISPDATRALSQGPSNQLKLWDAVSGQFLRSFERRSSVVGSVAASPDGTRLLTVDTKIRLWDASSGTLTRSIGEIRIGSPVAFSPDGTRLLAGRYNALDLWDVASGRRVRRITTLTPEHVAFSADGSRLLAFVPDPIMPDTRAKRLGNVVGWDAASGQRLLTFKVRSATGLSPAVAFSPAGTRFLAEPEYDQPFSMWDVASGKVLHTFGNRDNANHVQSSAFTADGARVASGHISGALRLWEPASGKLVRTMWHSRSVDAVAFSRDGSRLLSGSADNTVKLWDVATGKAIRTFEGHTGEVNSVAFSPDEKRVVSGSDDTTARVWDAATGELLAILLTRPVTRTRTGEWLVITPEGFFDASAKGAEMLTVVRGLQVFSIDQFYQGLYRPDLVREKLAGDPDGKVRAAAARLDLGKLVDSGRVPSVTIVSHKAKDSSPDDRITLEAQLVDQGGGIGRAEWRINGITVGVVEKAGAAAGKPISVKQTMALDPGENTIELVAYNGANLVASSPARARITWTGTEPSVPPRLHVLTVGINGYLDSALNLRYAVPDAKTLAAAFAEAGGGHYESVSVTNVLDSDATAAKLDRVFADLADKVRPRDVFVFFAAGHGKTLDGRYYFIPYDLRYQTDQSLKNDAIGQDQLQAWFARIQAKKAVLMFDTCEAGTLTQRQRVATRGGLEHKAALGRLIQATGRATLTASTATQEAYEGHGGHGVFTFALLDALGRGDLNSNGLVELAELIQHVDGLVPAITEKRWGAKQYPQMDAYGANFPLARQVPALAPASGDAVIIPIKPTHVSTENLRIFKEPGSGPVGEPLAAFKAVTLVKRQGAWALIARNGKTLGYVPDAKLHELK